MEEEIKNKLSQQEELLNKIYVSPKRQENIFYQRLLFHWFFL